MSKQKLFITDKGDTSVGILPQYWEIEVPFEISFPLSFSEEQNLIWFKEEQIKIYKEFCEGKCYGEYSYEIEKINKDLENI